MGQAALYKLGSMADNPAYEGFQSAEADANSPAALTFDKMRVLEGKQYKPRRLLRGWQPVRVTGNVRKANDFPAIGLVPVFSKRAADALRDLLEPNGELLPLESELGPYYAYNPTTTADVLDHTKSEIAWLAKPTAASNIRHYHVVPERLAELSIFCLPYLMRDVLVTNVFVDRVAAHGLKGMRFDNVWPLPPGVRWQEARREQLRRIDREGLSPGRTVKGNTVVVRLFLADESATAPTPAEERTVRRLEAELDARLVDPDATGPLVGSREGRDEVRGEVRLFLTCPDADALVEHLRPWLGGLRWPRGFLVLKRYGEYVDPDAPEQYVKDV